MGQVRGAWLVVAAGAVTLAAGCAGSGGGAPAPGSPAGGGELAGRAFLSTSVTADGQERPLVTGTRVRLAVDGQGRLNVSAGCNQLVGPATFDGGTLAVTDLAVTEMGCAAPLHEQDQWLADFLSAKPAWRLDGQTLTLRTGTKEIVMTDQRAVTPDQPLEGTRWEVESLVEGTAVGSVPESARGKAYLTISDGRITGSGGCNQMSGDAAVRGDKITFSPLAMTRMACTGDLDALEKAVVTALDGTVAWRVEGGLLQLSNPNGTGLQLRAAA